jgi:hypothetical protein
VRNRGHQGREEDLEPEVLLCPVCGKPVEDGDWFLVVNQAKGTVRTGHRTDGIPQRPVHLSCLVSFDPEKI